MAKTLLQLKKAMREYNKKIRQHDVPLGNPGHPLSAIVSSYGDEGYWRLRIALKPATGCGTPFCNMCPIPNESVGAGRISQEDLLKQFMYALYQLRSIHKRIALIVLFVSGNFLSLKEVSKDVRIEIYQTVAKLPNCQGLVIESLPNFVTESNIREANEHLRGKQFYVMMGLQSQDDVIRELLVGTPCKRDRFEWATHLLRQYDCVPGVYLMLQIPFLSPKESIEEACKSILYAKQLGYEQITLCPTRIAPHTVLYELAQRGLFVEPSCGRFEMCLTRLLRLIKVAGFGLLV